MRAGSNAILDELWSQLEQYFRGERHAFTLALAYPGTEFQEQVWSALQEIRYGESVTAAYAAAPPQQLEAQPAE